ncbi:sugar ABC transporter substrate-binding protein [Streptomyces inhibens]|uniref:sugar ABC transporter substrate-binding protein n=1 Tax=Streptomyces inhibens TaxID=2293571 RepID=UPI001EE6FEE1|nr:substrate-binding domain-containing protein [Streptomyces inhibens]UKY48317.1 substrate-binding domain-containing protein [Streptomyces inhibens]
MNARLRGAAVVLAGLCMVAGPAACGEAGGAHEPTGPASGGALKIGVLIPDSTSRFHYFDKPLIEKKIHQLCGECTVETVSAQHDVATQQQQMDAMITKQVNVLILDATDSKSLRAPVENARRAGIPVVAYDRLVEGPVSGYVSFDGAKVGRLQGEALLRALGDKAHSSQIVMMNGASTDPNSAWFKAGALSVLQGKVRIGKAYNTAGWRPEVANANMSGAIAALGAENIDGVYSANDGLASGIISALKAAKVDPLPPITGQDAELTAIQRIVAGEQYMTVLKPFKPEADAAATMAVALARGEKLDDIAKQRINSPTTHGIPAVLLTPVPVTVQHIKDTVIKDGMYTIDQICTPKYASACAKAGLTR